MKIAIIMGFTYDSSDEKYKLPGITVDLYHAYYHAKMIECDRILVITDSTEVIIDKDILNLIVEGKARNIIASFYEMLNKNGELLKFTTIESLLSKIELFSTDATNIMFYYSGHAHHGMALLPKYRHNASYDASKPAGMHVRDLVELITPAINSANSKCKVICVVDCCNSNGLRLPFRLRIEARNSGGEVVALNRKTFDDSLDVVGKYELVKLTEWPKGRDIICISATESGTTTFNTAIGSEFTVNLFNYLRDKDINNYIYMLTLMTVLSDNKSKTQIRASYPGQYVIPPWIKGPGTVSIVYEKMTHCLLVSS